MLRLDYDGKCGVVGWVEPVKGNQWSEAMSEGRDLRCWELFLREAFCVKNMPYSTMLSSFDHGFLIYGLMLGAILWLSKRD